MKALVRWATGKRLTNRLPKLSLITLSPPLNSGILGLRMGLDVPTPRFFTFSGDPGRVIYQDLDMRKYTFSLKSVFMVDVRFELMTNDPCPADDAICECISPLGNWQEVNQSPTQTKPYNTTHTTRFKKVMYNSLLPKTSKYRQGKIRCPGPPQVVFKGNDKPMGLVLRSLQRMHLAQVTHQLE